MKPEMIINEDSINETILKMKSQRFMAALFMFLSLFGAIPWYLFLWVFFVWTFGIILLKGNLKKYVNVSKK